MMKVYLIFGMYDSDGEDVATLCYVAKTLSEAKEKLQKVSYYDIPFKKLEKSVQKKYLDDIKKIQASKTIYVDDMGIYEVEL